MSTLPPEPPFDPSHDPRDARYDPRYDPRGPAYDPRFERRGSPPPYEGSRRRRVPLWAILAGLLALVLVAFFAFGLTRGGPGQDRLEDSAANSAAPDTQEAAAERCGSQRTYDLVKRELFRRAAQVRGSDLSAFDRLSAYAAIRVVQPVLKDRNEDLGTLVCSGQVSLDLPPGLGVVGGRRTLSAEMDYALTPAADRSGDVVTLTGADPIIVPLATLARTGAQPGLPPAAAPATPEASSAAPAESGSPPLSGGEPASPPSAPEPSRPVPSVSPSPPAPPPVPRAPEESASARPSFNCANARTRGEIAVCRDAGLAALDRQMASAFFAALRGATPQQRELLQRTRGRFLAFRDRCGSDACIAGAYRDRIREIEDIRNDRWRP